jgi:hypothetical protein
VLENGGFIKLYRSMLEWGWYKDANTKSLFLHLLLTANHKDNPFCGKLVKRGQRVCSRATLVKETGLSDNEIRTAIKHLLTNEITSENIRINRSNCTLITIVNYNKYQSNDQSITSESPVINQKQERKKDKNDKKIYIAPDLSESVQAAFASFKEMRVKMKKPMTDEAVRLAVNKLKGLASDEATQIAIINQSIERCWLSFFPLNDQNTQTKPRAYNRALDYPQRTYTEGELEKMGLNVLDAKYWEGKDE